jgi:hypothetical protein
MLDSFLKTTEKLERRHYDDLPAVLKSKVSPQTKLDLARTPDEAQRAVKEGASDMSRPFGYAVGRDDKEMAAYCLKTLKADPENGMSSAIYHGRLWAVEMIVDDGYKNMDTPLVWAAEEQKSPEIVEFLLSKGAKDPHGSALTKAVELATHPVSEKIALMILDRGGPDVDLAYNGLAVRGLKDGMKFLAKHVKNPAKVAQDVMTSNHAAEAIHFLWNFGRLARESLTTALQNSFVYERKNVAMLVIRDMEQSEIGEALAGVVKIIRKYGGSIYKERLQIFKLIVDGCEDSEVLDGSLDVLYAIHTRDAQEASEIVSFRLKELGGNRIDRT